MKLHTIKRVAAMLMVLTMGFAFTPVNAAQELPDYVVKAVAEVVAYSAAPFEPANRMKQGSGVFVDHLGCLYTNSHVVLDFTLEDIAPFIIVNVTEQRGKSAVYQFTADVIYVDQALDLAYICPKERSKEVFTHFFERKTTPAFDSTPYGKEIWTMGYPGSGGGTITISPGHVVGFIDGPDISDWYGVPNLDPELLKLYKTDALSGPGVSGGLLVDEELELIGIPFAGTLSPGAFVFSLSEDTYLEFERRVRLHLLEAGIAPADCVYDVNSMYYTRSGKQYYDYMCTYEQDDLLEHEVTQTWQAFCGYEISTQRKNAAVHSAKILGDLGRWSDNLIEICPQEDSDSSTGLTESVETEAGSFAYGKARLKSLEQEQSLAYSLKREIDTNFPQLQIAEDDWSTVVNSYIYGGYPLEAINKAIEVGGKSVHPSIPYDVWKGSDDYLSVM